MRRRNKEINIFSMSALDLFASAMGAFILIAVVALPYYLKTDKNLLLANKKLKKQVAVLEESLEVCRHDNDVLTQKNTTLTAENEQLDKDVGSCQKKLKETFIAVVMQWPNDRIDIDLYVIDPEGNKFYYKQHNRNREHYSGSLAKLSKDTIVGPGVEVWEIPVATKGNYEVKYHFHPGQGGRELTAKISGNIYTNKGSHAISDVSLKYDKWESVAVINIDADGNVSFN